MLSRIEVQNYRSFLDVKIDLSPFSLVIGANGSGKSNFLRLLRDINSLQEGKYYIEGNPKINSGRPVVAKYDLSEIHSQKHYNHTEEAQIICAKDIYDNQTEIREDTLVE